MSALHTVVVGAGLRGLAAALRARSEHPDQRVAVVDANPWAGGDVRSQRSNGFVCELGPFAFARARIEPLLARLRHAPRLLECRETARTGVLFDGTGRREVAVDPLPVSFATGCEEVVQACRRELDGALLLGRPVTAIGPADADASGRGGGGDGGLIVELGGEVPTRLATANVVVATGPVAAGTLLHAFEPEFAQLTPAAGVEHRAFVFLGDLASNMPEVRGYGLLADEPLVSPIAEVIHCTEVFAGRALRDRCLVRVETEAAELPDDDDELTETIVAELRRWNGSKAPFGFRKVHRFATPAADGVQAECRVRLHEIVARVPGLSLAP